MKKLVLFVLALFCFSFTSCSEPSEPKTFSDHGITITLTTAFEESMESGYWVLASKKIIFVANKESIALFQTNGIDLMTAEEYAELVLTTSNKTGTVESYNDENTSFAYTTYVSTVDSTDYQYLMICMVGENYYYCMNFSTFKSSYSKYEEKLMEYAKTIRVE